ncbi:hypothetical protein QUB68_02430 [Microcoleus sp. A006_D1]
MLADRLDIADHTQAHQVEWVVSDRTEGDRAKSLATCPIHKFSVILKHI